VQAPDNDSANRFAASYGESEGAMVGIADDPGRSKLVVQILTFTGQPFVDEPAVLLSALKPAAGVDFGDDIGAAVNWAVKKYGIAPNQLRPRLYRDPPKLPGIPFRVSQ
jgi:hypothetical protein